MEEQIEIISSGSVEIIPEDEMSSKIKRSIVTGKPLRVKFGVDPTRPDLHIGHAVPLVKLGAFQELGHSVILIIGDFTALVGDPSEQDATRPILTPQEVERNARTYIEQAEKIIDISRARIVRNSHWLSLLKLQDVLNIASKFTVARILERDDFSKRYREGKPLGLHEFLYPVMQAYDSVVLEADIEIGGTDQKFNLLAGRNLQRAMGQDPQCVITLPLLEGTDGVWKMSKSLGNDISLSDSSDEMFGKLMSIPDELIWKYMSLSTRMKPDEISSIRKEVEDGKKNPRDAKERLAVEVVGFYHGTDEAKKAAENFSKVFREGGVPEKIPVARIEANRFEKRKVWIVELLVSLKVASTNGEARRLIEGGGISLDGRKIVNIEEEMPVEELDGKILKKGRRTFIRIEVIE
ncbi:MAG: tyrosine--tRNA ligase [Actinomycetota bacterium]|nr:tyrosine--tRNA ligase [Actinomycetota bacterium]